MASSARAPKSFEVLTTHACFRPQGQMTLAQAADLVAEAVRFAHENGIRRLLVDVVKLTGFESPSKTERYVLAERFAFEAMGMVKAAMLVRSEMIHAEDLGELVAQNRGLTGRAFDSETEALAWLLDPESG